MKGKEFHKTIMTDEELSLDKQVSQVHQAYLRFLTKDVSSDNLKQCIADVINVAGVMFLIIKNLGKRVE